MKTSTSNGAKNVTLSKAQLVSKRLAGASCARCVYLHPADDGGYCGECRRSAPAPGLVQLAGERAGVVVTTRPTWPLMRAIDSCGEFLPRPRQ